MCIVANWKQDVPTISSWCLREKVALGFWMRSSCIKRWLMAIFYYAMGAVQSTLWKLELPFLRVTGLVRAIACMQQTSQLRCRDSSVWEPGLYLQVPRKAETLLTKEKAPSRVKGSGVFGLQWDVGCDWTVWCCGLGSEWRRRNVTQGENWWATLRVVNLVLRPIFQSFN